MRKRVAVGLTGVLIAVVFLLASVSFESLAVRRSLAECPQLDGDARGECCQAAFARCVSTCGSNASCVGYCWHQNEQCMGQ